MVNFGLGCECLIQCRIHFLYPIILLTHPNRLLNCLVKVIICYTPWEVSSNIYPPYLAHHHNLWTRTGCKRTVGAPAGQSWLGALPKGTSRAPTLSGIRAQILNHQTKAAPNRCLLIIPHLLLLISQLFKNILQASHSKWLYSILKLISVKIKYLVFELYFFEYRFKIICSYKFSLSKFQLFCFTHST